MSKPNYENMGIEDGTITIELSAEEKKVILHAHDRGIHAVDIDVLNRVIAKLKDQIWP